MRPRPSSRRSSVPVARSSTPPTSTGTATPSRSSARWSPTSSPAPPWCSPPPPSASPGRGRLLATLDESLGRLGTDHVDVWMVHGFDAAVPIEETCSAVSTAVDSGRAVYVGVSGHSAWQLATLASWLRSAGCPLVTAEAEYSLVDRAVEESMLPAAAVHGMGMFAWAPLGRGVLTGKYRRGTPADSRGASPTLLPLRRPAPNRDSGSGGGGGRHRRRRPRHVPARRRPAPGYGTVRGSRALSSGQETRPSCSDRWLQRNSRCRRRSVRLSTT